MDRTQDTSGDTTRAGNGEGGPGPDFTSEPGEVCGTTGVAEGAVLQGPYLFEVSRQDGLVRVSEGHSGVTWVLDRAAAAKIGLALLLSASGLAHTYRSAGLAALLEQLAVAAAGEPPDGERGGATPAAATPA